MEALDFKSTIKALQICDYCERFFLKKFIDEATLPEITPEPSTPLNKEFKISDYINLPCPNCMGINQLVNDQKFLSFLYKSIIDSGFEFEGFNFNFKFPLSLKLRQKYFHMILSKSGIETPADQLFEFDIKSTIKNILNLEIAVRSGVSVIPNEDFVISIEFGNPGDEHEFVI
jgi:hypothetical protein